MKKDLSHPFGKLLLEFNKRSRYNES